MLYRENGQFKTSYRADQQVFPITQDRVAIGLLLRVRGRARASALLAWSRWQHDCPPSWENKRRPRARADAGDVLSMVFV